jgi:serine/threonine protein kinase
MALCSRRCGPSGWAVGLGPGEGTAPVARRRRGWDVNSWSDFPRGGEIVGDEPAGDAGVLAGLPGGFPTGAQVAGFRLERPLGRGGMAVVYLARDERLDRLVALKVLAPALAADEAFRTRFIRESRAAAAVDHPHIIPVFEAGEAGGVLFIAMRYVPGGDVGSIVRREGPLSLGRAVSVIGQVGSALDAAHAAGLLHRDVKPGNMLVDGGLGRAEHVYLADFGLSKKTLAASVGLTGTGQFLGTLDYVAPEQIQGRAADGRTDQYGLACAAFELLAGAPPFQREEATAVIYAHLADPPPPVTSRRADLPPGLDEVLARALAKEPAGRYPCCRDFADALQRALGAAPPRPVVPAAEQPAPDHPPTQAAPASDGRAPAAGAAAGTASRPYAEASLPTQDIPIPAQPSGAGTAAPTVPAPPAASEPVADRTVSGPDSYPATTASPGPHARDDDQPPAAPGPAAPQQATPQPPATAAPPSSPSVSQALPKRRRVWLLAGAAAVIAAGVGVAVSRSGSGLPATMLSPATTLADPDGASVDAVAFGPGGTTLAAGDGNGSIYLWDTATRSVTALLTDPGGGGAVDSVAFGPGETTLATGSGNGSTYLWDTSAASITGSVTATLTDPGSKGVDSVAFGPGGTTLAAGDGNGSTYLWNTATGKITATLTDPGSAGVNAVAFGPGGTTLATGDGNGSTYLWDTATGKLTATLTDPGRTGVQSVAFGPGGTTLAAGDHDGSTYLWDTATRKLTATLTDPGRTGVQSVAFGPGGTTLATGDHDGSTYLWDTATGKIATTITDPHSTGVNAVAFGPGGTTLATGDLSGSTYLWNIASNTP